MKSYMVPANEMPMPLGQIGIISALGPNTFLLKMRLPNTVRFSSRSINNRQRHYPNSQSCTTHSSVSRFLVIQIFQLRNSESEQSHCTFTKNRGMANNHLRHSNDLYHCEISMSPTRLLRQTFSHITKRQVTRSSSLPISLLPRRPTTRPHSAPMACRLWAPTKIERSYKCRNGFRC
jgi:hypothetical protein